MLGTGVPKASIKTCHVEMEMLGIQTGRENTVKQRDHSSHYDQELWEKKVGGGG